MQGDSDLSDSDRSDGFTQALQKLKNAAPAALKQPAEPVPVPQNKPDLPDEPVVAAADQHLPSPVDKKPEKGTGEGARAKAAAQRGCGGHPHGGRDLQAGIGARAQQSTRTAQVAGDAVVEATENRDDAPPATCKAAADASKTKAAPVKITDKKQTAKGQKQPKKQHRQNVTHALDMGADDAGATAELHEQQPKRKRCRQPAAQTKQADDADIQDLGPSSKKVYLYLTWFSYIRYSGHHL